MARGWTRMLPEWKPCVVFGRPAIFSETRLDDRVEDAMADLGFELADIRHAECDLTTPISIEMFVLVNWFGTMAFPKGMLPCSEGRQCDLEPGDFLARDYDWDSEYDDVYEMAEKIEAEVEKGLENELVQ